MQLVLKALARIHLSFPTDDEFPLGFLVNGDFVTDAGRQGIQTSAEPNMQLISASYSAVLDRLAHETEFAWTKVKWLAWARVLRLRQPRSKAAPALDGHL
jgi:hypothetical protein